METFPHVAILYFVFLKWKCQKFFLWLYWYIHCYFCFVLYPINVSVFWVSSGEWPGLTPLAEKWQFVDHILNSCLLLCGLHPRQENSPNLGWESLPWGARHARLCIGGSRGCCQCLPLPKSSTDVVLTHNLFSKRNHMGSQRSYKVGDPLQEILDPPLVCPVHICHIHM